MRGTVLAWVTGQKGEPAGATADISSCLLEAEVQDDIQQGLSQPQPLFLTTPALKPGQGPFR